MHGIPDVIAGRAHAEILALAEQFQSRPGRHIYRLSRYNVLQLAHRLQLDTNDPINIVNNISTRDVLSGLVFGKRNMQKLGAALRAPPRS